VLQPSASVASTQFPPQSLDGDGLRRSAHKPGGALTTSVWYGDDYLMEKTP
jgi:hypothetical protein